MFPIGLRVASLVNSFRAHVPRSASPVLPLPLPPAVEEKPDPSPLLVAKARPPTRDESSDADVDQKDKASEG